MFISEELTYYKDEIIQKDFSWNWFMNGIDTRENEKKNIRKWTLKSKLLSKMMKVLSLKNAQYL